MQDDSRCEVWVQDLTDRNLFFNRSMNLKLPESALQNRPNPILKISYDDNSHRAIPFGYVWDATDQIVVASDQADIVRKIFAYRDQGLSAEKIAKKLDGITAANGGTIWHPAVVREIIKNEQAYRSGSLSSDSSLRLPPILT